ncbi:MAG: hypothetical protein EBZ78_13005, partial [Verrucomicrobia bacterium]|nr:hypothetical protein [Verrucomicrobiota bacterium]
SPAAGLTYPAPLSSTQLNATSTVVGNWSYNPTNGSVLNVGTYTLVGTFTPNDTANYTNATITNTVVVAKGSNNILFGALPIKYVGDAAFNLTATASSGLTVTYTSSNPNVATVLGSLVTIVGEGNTTITASQAGDSDWNAATSVTQTLTVQPALNRGLVAYYPFNGNANDASGNGYDATTTGDPGGALNAVALTQDRLGIGNQAYHFPGRIRWTAWDPVLSNYTSSWMSVPGTGSRLRNLTSFTLSCWIKLYDPINDYGPSRILTNEGDDYSGIRGLGLYYNRNSGFGFGVGWGGGGETSTWSGVPPQAGRFYLVTATYDGTRAAIYVDGQLAASQNVSYPLQSTKDLSIGRHVQGPISNPPGFTGEIVADLDEIRIYSRALSAVEIGQLYQQEAGNLDTDGDG